MVKVLAQVNNLRRGHDTQGKLKKKNIDQTYEGDTNSMAPEGMEKIRCKVEKANRKAGKKVFDERILKPRTETYLTPKWDKMVLFPTSTHILPYLFTTSWRYGPHSLEIPFQRLRAKQLRFRLPHHAKNPDDPLYTGTIDGS